ncbi:TetR/AcrR family transcriptional regulator [Nocardia callitridis]
MNRTRAVVGDRRPPSRGDQQRGRIIDAVVDLLETTSIAELSVTSIARQAGVGRQAFYFYFESKYAVVAAALEQVWTELDTATAELADYDFQEPPAPFTIRMIDDAVVVWERHGALLNACLQARPSDPQLSDLWDTFLANLSGKLATFIATLRDNGHAAPATVDTPALTHALVGLTVWTLTEKWALAEKSTAPQPLSAERLMDATRAIWIASMWGDSR